MGEVISVAGGYKDMFDKFQKQICICENRHHFTATTTPHLLFERIDVNALGSA